MVWQHTDFNEVRFLCVPNHGFQSGTVSFTIRPFGVFPSNEAKCGRTGGTPGIRRFFFSKWVRHTHRTDHTGWTLPLYKPHEPSRPKAQSTMLSTGQFYRQACFVSPVRRLRHGDPHSAQAPHGSGSEVRLRPPGFGHGQDGVLSPDAEHKKPPSVEGAAALSAMEAGAPPLVSRRSRRTCTSLFASCKCCRMSPCSVYLVVISSRPWWSTRHIRG